MCKRTSSTARWLQSLTWGTKARGCRRLPALTSCLTRVLRTPLPTCRESTIADRESIMSSNYNALQTSLQRRLKSGLAFNCALIPGLTL